MGHENVSLSQASLPIQNAFVMCAKNTQKIGVQFL